MGQINWGMCSPREYIENHWKGKDRSLALHSDDVWSILEEFLSKFSEHPGVNVLPRILRCFKTHGVNALNYVDALVSPGYSHRQRCVALSGEEVVSKRQALISSKLNAGGRSFKERLIARGISEEEASYRDQQRILKSHATRKERGNYGGQMRSPACVDYWTNKGYNEAEATELARRQVFNLKSLEDYQQVFGDDEGAKKFHSRQQRRLQTCCARYGSKIVTGKTSKESLVVLAKIKEALFPSDKEYWGNEGAKEYMLQDADEDRVYFYDFAVPSHKVIVEYHNVFWHPREGDEHMWRATYYDFDSKLAYDRRKETVASEAGFKVFVIWSDRVGDLDSIIEEIRCWMNSFMSSV